MLQTNTKLIPQSDSGQGWVTQTISKPYKFSQTPYQQHTTHLPKTTQTPFQKNTQLYKTHTKTMTEVMPKPVETKPTPDLCQNKFGIISIVMGILSVRVILILSHQSPKGKPHPEVTSQSKATSLNMSFHYKTHPFNPKQGGNKGQAQIQSI